MATAERSTIANLSPVLIVGVVGAVAALWLWRGPSPDSAATTTALAVDAESVYEFASIEAMTQASDLVVSGEVLATERGRLVGDPANGGIVSRLVTIRVDGISWDPTGSAPATIIVEEEGWLVDSTPIVVNGVQASEAGDVGLWFLDLLASDEAPIYLVINSQGRFLADDGAVRGGDQRDALVQALQQHSMTELIAMIEGVAEESR